MIKRVLVRCPSTAKLTPTGQTVEEESWGATKLKQHRFDISLELTIPSVRIKFGKPRTEGIELLR